MPIILKTLQYLFIGLILSYVLLCALVFIYQRNFLYFPTPKYNHPYPTLNFHNENETIKVIVLNKGKENAILYFGGNGEAVLNNAQEFIHDFPYHTVYLVNYRGYGGSSGNPTEDAIYADALHIYDELKLRHKRISIIGRSLGTGVATYVGAERNVHKISLITPFDSIENVAKTHYPIFPVALLLKDKHDSIPRVNRIKAPILIMLAEFDKVIPFEHSKRLIDAFPPAQISARTIANTGHNDISGPEEYHALLSEFMQ